MKTTIEFRLAVHEVMIDMTLDCTFPMDMNGLCIDTIFEKANAKLEGDKQYQEMILKEKLGTFLTADADLDICLGIWNNLTCDSDKDLAEDHLPMCGIIDGSMTIKQLAEQL